MCGDRSKQEIMNMCVEYFRSILEVRDINADTFACEAASFRFTYREIRLRSDKSSRFLIPWFILRTHIVIQLNNLSQTDYVSGSSLREKTISAQLPKDQAGRLYCEKHSSQIETQPANHINHWLNSPETRVCRRNLCRWLILMNKTSRRVSLNC